MSPQIATFVFAFGILGLFALNHDRNARPSFALWIPVVWLWVVGSRSVSLWLTAAGLAEERVIYSPSQLLDGSPLDRNVFAILLALGIVVLANRGRKVVRLLRANLPILVFFIYCALSTLWSDYTDVSFKRWIKALGDLVMVLVVLTDPDRDAAVKRLLARVTFILVPLSILVIKYYPEISHVYDNLTGVQAVTGVTMGKNLLGMVCLISGLAAEWYFFQALRGRNGIRRFGPLLAQGTILAMVLRLFWLADSMTSLSCFVLASALMMVARIRMVARRPSLVHVFVLTLICISASALFLDLGGDVLKTMGRDPTLTGRTGVWKVVLGMTGNPLLGTGFESFWLGSRLEKIWRIYWWHPNEAHNGYIEVFLNLGWIGVTLFMVLMATGYRNVFRAFRRDPETGRLKLAYFVAAVVYSFTEAAMRMLNPVWILFLMASISVPEDSARTTREVAEQHQFNPSMVPCVEEV